MPRRTMRVAAWVTAGLVLALAPLAAAQEADLRITDLTVQTLDGERLANPGVNELIEVVAEITNMGSAEDGSEPIQVNLTVTAPSGATATMTRSVTPDRSANGTTEVVFDWRPGETGEHTLNATLPNGASGVRTVTVTETAKTAGTLVDRFVDFWFVTAAFAASVVLFGVVGAVRRKP